MTEPITEPDDFTPGPDLVTDLTAAKSALAESTDWLSTDAASEQLGATHYAAAVKDGRLPGYSWNGHPITVHQADDVARIKASA